jgi:RNA polymerase sigma-70 factor (ECF subfamily)
LSATDIGANLDRDWSRETVRAAIEKLPLEFREVITLRELEECSYKEIAEIAKIPIGTVMSRLARAREQLQQILAKSMMKESQ